MKMDYFGGLGHSTETFGFLASALTGFGHITGAYAVSATLLPRPNPSLSLRASYTRETLYQQ